MDGTVLVADDDRTIRTVLTQALTRAGCKVHATSSLVTLARWVDEGKGDLVISDVMMPDGNGLEYLPQISASRPGLPVIIISAQNTILTAIQAAEAEAYDYLPKPFDLPDLMRRARKALDRRRSAQPPPRAGAPQAVVDLPLIGQTPAMQALYRLIARVLNTDLNVMITGESGTGKSLIARIIHDFSDRRNLPYVTAVAADLEQMDGPAILLSRAKTGTLVFDEVGDLDAAAQGRVVRMLDSLSDPTPRIMATSQTNLGQAIETGAFRQDLYYRLCGVTVPVPPLRDRVDDIALIATNFLARSDRDTSSPRHIADDGVALMRVYSWPGNVRQLDNLIRRLMATGDGDEITRTEIEAALANQPAMRELNEDQNQDRLSASVARHLRRCFDLMGSNLPPPGLYGRILREIELPLIEIALDATGGNQAKCADLLGINRNTLRKKITELDISVTRRRKLM